MSIPYAGNPNARRRSFSIDGESKAETDLLPHPPLPSPTIYDVYAGYESPFDWHGCCFSFCLAPLSVYSFRVRENHEMLSLAELQDRLRPFCERHRIRRLKIFVTAPAGFHGQATRRDYYYKTRTRRYNFAFASGARNGSGGNFDRRMLLSGEGLCRFHAASTAAQVSEAASFFAG
jgi:hypothetical protein